MKSVVRYSALAAFCPLVLLALPGCDREGSLKEPPAAVHGHAGGSAAHEDHEDEAHGHSRADEAMQDHHIAVPESVRRNLGITFAKVETRAVARTIRFPGRFELLPKARREYRTMLSGQVELHVSQFDPVEPGTLLYTLDSPAWRELQERLNEADSTIQQATARVQTMKPLMDAHKQHEESLRNSVEVWTERVRQLEKGQGSGVISAETFAQARGTLSQNRSDLAEVMEKEAELEARRVEVEAELSAARERMELLLLNAASLLGISKEALTTRPSQADGDPHQLWRSITKVDVRAAAPGLVQSMALTNGSWASETSLVLTTVQPELIRFRAQGLQSDLGRLRDGLPALIVPPKGGSISIQDTMEGTVSLGVLANPDERTIEVLVTPARLTAWARPGVTAHLEVVTEGSGAEELAIPLSATIRDGLTTVFFRRNPENPNEVIRVEGDLGINDGRWVVVKRGVREGDEVVLDGVYQLMLASSAGAQQGGHYDSDGTFHTGSH
jgi:multidrug resistance efflux pump